jgi:ribosome maturation factor RimP
MDKAWDGQRNLRGILKGFEGDTVTIEDRKAGEVSFPLKMVHSAQLVLTDELIAATQPLDVSGVEDIVEEEEAQD